MGNNCYRIDLEKAGIKDFKSFPYSLAYARMVMHHIKNIDKVFDLVYKLLDSRGRFLICEGIPPDKSCIDLYEKIFKLKEKRRVIIVEEIVKKLKESGFNNIKVHYYTMKQVSLMNWIKNAGIPEENKKKILDLHFNAPDNWVKAYNYQLDVKNSDILMDWKFACIKGIKK